MSFTKGTCADCDIFDSHIMNLFHNHIYYVITFTEVMVETYSHSVFDAAFYKYIMNAVYNFTSIGVDDTFCHCSVSLEYLSVEMVISLKYLFPCKLQNLFRNISSNCIDHLINPPYIHLKPLQVRWFVLLHRRRQYQSFFHLL